MALAPFVAATPMPRPGPTNEVRAPGDAHLGNSTPAPTLIDSPLLSDGPLTPRVERKLSEGVVKHLEECGKKHRRNIEKYLKLKQSVESTNKQIEIFDEDDGSTRRYPPGVRPFKSQCELTTLDAGLHMAVDEDVSVTVSLPKGISRREAMAKVHHEVARWYKQVHWEALDAATTEAKALTSKSAFLTLCNSWKDPNKDVDALALRIL